MTTNNDLTEYQNLLFAMLLTDMSTAEIAEHMGRYSWILARTYRRIYAKMGVRTRRQLIAKYRTETSQQELRDLISRQLDEVD